MALFFACSQERQAQAGDFSDGAIGTAGSEFLNVDAGPRGIAMGGAFAAATQDAYSMYWNPAGLSRVSHLSMVAMHNEYLAGIRFHYFAYAQRFNDTSVFAAAVRYMDGGSIANTNISGVEIGTFRPRNYVYELGWGKNIVDMTDTERDISMGITARYFRSDLIAHADGFSGDLGIQAHYTEAYLPYHLAAVVQNAGRGQKFDKTRDNLPLRGRLGLAVLPTRLTLLALEAVFPISNNPYGAAGFELTLEPARTPLKAFLRAGYNSINQFSGLEGLRGLSLGMGLQAGNLGFDYAFVPFGILGEAHRFSFSWNLPTKRSRKYRYR